MTNQPVNLKEPKFIKEFSETNKQIKDLDELLEIASDEVSKKIE